MIDYGNRNLYGRGGRATIQDLLKGLNAHQVNLMRKGFRPGHEGGDFTGITPERLRAIAAMMEMQHQMLSGNQQEMYQLEHHRGDGLFRQAPGGMPHPRGPVSIPPPGGPGSAPYEPRVHPGAPPHLMPGGGSGMPPVAHPRMPMVPTPGAPEPLYPLRPGGGSGMPPVRAPFAGGVGRVNPGGLMRPPAGVGHQLYPMLIARALGR